MSNSAHVTILGVSESMTSTACLIRDGRVIACVSEERLNRIKSASGFPTLAVQEVLRIAGLEAGDVDRLVLHGNSPWMYGYFGENQLSQQANQLNKTSRSLLSIRSALSKALYHLPAAWPAYELLRDKLYRAQLFKRWNEQRTQSASKLSGVPIERIVRTDHHTCHAYAGLHGVLGHPQNDYLVLTNDGHGDDCCATVSTYRKGKWQRLASTPNQYSLADIYMEITSYLGMKPNEHEYKVMGLAPYAANSDIERVLPLLQPLLWRSGLKFKGRISDQAYYDYIKDHLERQRFDWIAGAAQRLVETLLQEWTTAAIRHTGLHDVVLSGGTFHNVKANMSIGALPDVATLAICPSPGDDSSAIGAAYWGYEQECLRRNLPFEPQPIENLYLGTEYSTDKIAHSIERFRAQGLECSVEQSEQIEDRIAELLAEGQVVARFAGRMEFGARALGNRSLLAHPTHPRVIDVLNHQVKNRDFWMPFAGTILSERQHDYLHNPKGLPAPHMVLAFHSTPLAQRELAAAMHPADHTIRPQVLDKATNPSYYKVIKQFEARTGVGAVLNTSLNIHGEPVVCSPDDALSTFSRSGLRYLALGHFLLSKPGEEPTGLVARRSEAIAVSRQGVEVAAISS
jgi:carbamoyltransferase